LGCGVFIACAFLSGVTGGCRDDSTQTSQEVAVQTNVVWILLDALRADHLSSHGYDRPTSPVLDALAARGIRATNAFSQASATLLSVPTFMTGRYEPAFYQDARHFDVWFLRRPPPEERLVSTIFKTHGYETAMFSASPWYSAGSNPARAAWSFTTFAMARPLCPDHFADVHSLIAECLMEWGGDDSSADHASER
jgi:arylsulfatase A-like enzyme